MLECISFKSLPPPSSHASSLSALPHSQGDSTDSPSAATSPGANVSTEYDRAVQAPSYNEIRSMIQAPPNDHLHHLDLHLDADDSHHRHVLAHALQPDRNSVRDFIAVVESRCAVGGAALTRLVSDYFDHSESTVDLYLLLHRSVRRARAIYEPIHDLLAVLPPSGSFSQHLCYRAFDLFVQFDGQENPFVFPDSRSFSGVRGSFSELKMEIERRRRLCHQRIRLFRRCHTGCMVCLFLTAVGAVASAALVTAHAVAGFAAVAAAPFCRDSCLPRRQERKERARLVQLDAASKGTLVMNDLDTINSLVDRLQSAIESDRAIVRFALERGKERHPIQEVLKQLRKNQQSFEPLLMDLEEQIFLCFNAVNKARSSLLQEIYQNL